jgi:cysteine-rich repeat protein
MSLRPPLACAALLLLPLLACEPEGLRTARHEAGAACEVSGDCVEAALCVDAVCRTKCSGPEQCSDPALFCDRGGCLPKPVVCGDGILAPAEECDDGNKVSDDGCSELCRTEAPPAWVASAFGACSVTCGDGTHARTARCEAGGVEVNADRCHDAMPALTEPCHERSGCACAPETCTDTCTITTPGEYPVVVPAGCGAVRVEAWGGGGAGGNQAGATGGAGAYAGGKVAITDGETLTVEVAEGGVAAGSGGGASAVRRGTTLLLIAAGGGGGGSDGCSGNCGTSGGAGGAGGGSLGEDGTNLGAAIPPYVTSATGGKGGSWTAGGAGGTTVGAAEHQCPGQPGSSEAGGSANGGHDACYLSFAHGWHAGGGQDNGGGGGGGSGYFGGGGAGFVWTYAAGGGGGGSSWAAPGVSSPYIEGGARQVPGNGAAAAGAGAGGALKTNGAAGRVVLRFGN